MRGELLILVHVFSTTLLIEKGGESIVIYDVDLERQGRIAELGLEFLKIDFELRGADSVCTVENEISLILACDLIPNQARKVVEIVNPGVIEVTLLD